MAREQAANEETPGRAQPSDGETEAQPAERETEREASERVERDLDELTAAKRERDEYLELAQRTRADFDNYRKRVAKETAEAGVRGKAELARELIPVVDNLERALEAAGREREGAEALTKGVTLVLEDLRSILGRAGVEAYDPAGEPFDPSWHEALQTQAAEGEKAGVVIEVLEKGYRLDGQVLRPARVVVSE